MFLLEFNEGKSGAGNGPTCPPLFHHLCRDSEHTQHFRHNLSHYIRNRHSRWDFCIGLEAYKEVFELVEEFDQRISAGSRVPCRLCKMVLWRST